MKDNNGRGGDGVDYGTVGQLTVSPPYMKYPAYLPVETTCFLFKVIVQERVH